MYFLEVWYGIIWVGGIFGVVIGKAFFVEYMYSCMEGGGVLLLSLLVW